MTVTEGTSKREIWLNASNMNSIGHIAHGLWRHPRDTSMRYHDIEYWTDLARLLERGLFDGLFLADIVGVNDVFGASYEAACRAAVQLPIGDPMLLVSAMAAVTRHLGFGVTANLSYEPPYLLARRFSTLDHLTKGRIGWNIVTGYLDSAARALGREHQVAHDQRCAVAEDYMECVYKLWEGSWSDRAVLHDRRAAYTPTRPRFTKFTMLAHSTSLMASICASLRRSARQSCFRSAPLPRARTSPASMPNACSSPGMIRLPQGRS